MLFMHAMDINAVDLNLLKALSALLSERAVTRAANRVGLSQPAMSHALSRLREVFEDELFVRTPRGLEPTPRAREIAALIGPAIERIEAALNIAAAFDPAKSERIFTAGMAGYAEVALIERLADVFARVAPRATLRLVPATGADFADRLDGGSIDVVVARLGALPPRFESAPLLRDRFVVIARRGHPSLNRSLTREAYAAQTHILVSPRGDTTGAVDRALAEHGLERRIALLVGTYSVLPLALARSDHIATVPFRTAQPISAMADLEVHQLPIELMANVSMAWHRRDTREPAHAWFRALLLECAAN
jgi:DNA-binding transcriptional LysR family regulator